MKRQRSGLASQEKTFAAKAMPPWTNAGTSTGGCLKFNTTRKEAGDERG
jgi:hypothetical protein